MTSQLDNLRKQFKRKNKPTCEFCGNFLSMMRMGRPKGFCSSICKEKWEKEKYNGKCADCNEPIITKWGKMYCSSCSYKRSIKDKSNAKT